LKGFTVDSHDYTKQLDPDRRVDQLLNLRIPESDCTVLIGSSMGGYVATVASQMIVPVGLFLMAPAFYLPGYQEQSPSPYAIKTVIIHGLNDDVVPTENSIRFALEHHAELHLLDSGHRLDDQLPKIEMLLDMFLDEVLELSNLSKIFTWAKIAQKFGNDDPWVQRIWEKMAEAGHASYRDKAGRTQVLLRFIALTDFYYTFLSGFSRDHWGCEPEETAEKMGLTHEALAGLVKAYMAGQGMKPVHVPTAHDALQEIAKTYVYPIIREYFGDIEGVATSIYITSYPTFFDEDANEYLTDPEVVNAVEIAEMEAFKAITDWLKGNVFITIPDNSNPQAVQ